MKINGFIDGVAIFRMPRELNNEIADLPISVTGLSEIKNGERLDLAQKYGFLRILPPPADAEHDVIGVAQWTDFGLAIARKFRWPRVLRNRTHLPHSNLSTLLDVIPAHIRDGLLSDPPVLEKAPGAFFVALGVCDGFGGAFTLTHFGRRALAGYRVHQMSGDEGAVLLTDFFSPPVRRYMRRVLEAGPGGLPVLGDNGLPQHRDGRELRPFDDANAAVLLAKEVVNTEYAKKRMMWVHYIAEDMIPFVRACVDGAPMSALEVFRLFPAKDQYAFMKEFAAGDTQRVNMFVRLGWLTRRHGGSYAHSKLGARHAQIFREDDERAEVDAALMRQMERDERRAAYVPDDLTLDDLTPDADPFDLGITTEAEHDPFDIL